MSHLRLWDRDRLRAAVEEYFREHGWEFCISAVSLDNLVPDLEHAVAWFYVQPGKYSNDLPGRLKKAVEAVTGRDWEFKDVRPNLIRLRRFTPGTPINV